jgi:hypothetical protein
MNIQEKISSTKTEPNPCPIVNTISMQQITTCKEVPIKKIMIFKNYKETLNIYFFKNQNNTKDKPYTKKIELKICQIISIIKETLTMIFSETYLKISQKAFKKFKEEHNKIIIKKNKTYNKIIRVFWQGSQIQFSVKIN